jgi:hypothetical protein
MINDATLLADWLDSVRGVNYVEFKSELCRIICERLGQRTLDEYWKQEVK